MFRIYQTGKLIVGNCLLILFLTATCSAGAVPLEHLKDVSESFLECIDKKDFSAAWSMITPQFKRHFSDQNEFIKLLTMQREQSFSDVPMERILKNYEQADQVWWTGEKGQFIRIVFTTRLQRGTAVEEYVLLREVGDAWLIESISCLSSNEPTT